MNERMPGESVEDMRVRLGLDLLEQGRLYTAGRLAFTVKHHYANRKPHLALALFPAWFVEAMAELKLVTL